MHTQWKKTALEKGLPEDLAELGRKVMRESQNHGWDEALQKECGASDEGKAMLQNLRKRPKTTKLRLLWLLVTDGERLNPWTRREIFADKEELNAMFQTWRKEQKKQL